MEMSATIVSKIRSDGEGFSRDSLTDSLSFQYIAMRFSRFSLGFSVGGNVSTTT